MREIGETFVSERGPRIGRHADNRNWRVVAIRPPQRSEYYENSHTVVHAGGDRYERSFAICVPYDPAHGPWPLPNNGRPRGMRVGRLVERLASGVARGEFTDETEVWFGTGLEGDSDEPLSDVFGNQTAIWPKLDEWGSPEDRWERHDYLQHRLHGVVLLRP